ncbi:hypothetical protein [Magnetofaba australis]|uniref:hypothetical protein n=1 Tax=Magnetofaba australis TaxID=1472297 RepID=UPI000A19F722|nr:hypothetical protein [Magnetofaba australis]
MKKAQLIWVLAAIALPALTVQTTEAASFGGVAGGSRTATQFQGNSTFDPSQLQLPNGGAGINFRNNAGDAAPRRLGGVAGARQAPLKLQQSGTFDPSQIRSLGQGQLNLNSNKNTPSRQFGGAR